MIVEVNVSNKIAKRKDKLFFGVCGNSDYIIHFNFDDEWNEYETKTARFKWNGSYVDVIFTGTDCNMPVVQDTYSVEIGIYAGNLRTTTSAYLPMKKSILCGSGFPTDPPDDVYNQIMTKLNELGGANPEDIAKAVADYLTEHPLEEKDPTVPAWAKAAEKPTYTAKEVGAIGDDELPTAIDMALAQAKASGEFDGAAGKPGSNGKDGTDGKDGVNGITPTIGDNGNWYLGTTDTGKPSRGVKGDKGADGHTPEKGVDYWTAADKSEIVQDTLAALPAWTGGNY